MSALPIGGEGRDTPRRGVPAENEAVRGGGASGVKEETEPMTKKLDEENGVWSLLRKSFFFVSRVLKRSVRGVFKGKWASSWASGSVVRGEEDSFLRSFKAIVTAFRTSLFGFGKRGWLVRSDVVEWSLVEKLGRRRRPSVFASEDMCEGEDVPTGHERRQRTAREVLLFFYFFFTGF